MPHQYFSRFGLPNPSIHYTYIDNTKGYQFTTAVFAANTEGYMKETDEFAPISVRKRAYVESIKSYCDDNGAKLIFVSTPSTINWKTPRHNSIQRLSEELGVDYVDMNLLNEQIPIDWEKDTSDKGDHLNYFGAKKVTAYLGKYLSNTGLVNSHKDDQTAKRWNDDLENFNNTVAASLPKETC